MSEKLKPCPFCGGDNARYVPDEATAGVDVSCPDCGAIVSQNNIGDWNRRAAPAVAEWLPDDNDKALIRLALNRLVSDAYSRAFEAAQDKAGRFFAPGDAAKYLADAKHAEKLLIAMAEKPLPTPPNGGV